MARRRAGADALGALDPIAFYVGGERRPVRHPQDFSALGHHHPRAASARAPGEEVAIELATGQRPAGTIDWVAGGEAGIRFKQPIDMLALLNRKLVSQPAERRTMPRVELRCGVGTEVGRQPGRGDAAQHFRATDCRSKATTCRRAALSCPCSSTG